jgi:hypothetical protein
MIAQVDPIFRFWSLPPKAFHFPPQNVCTANPMTRLVPGSMLVGSALSCPVATNSHRGGLCGQTMVKSGGLPFVFDKSRPTRFGVLPKKATSPDGIRWFEAPPAVIFHVANAWQEGDLLKLYAVAFQKEVRSSSSSSAYNGNVSEIWATCPQPHAMTPTDTRTYP